MEALGEIKQKIFRTECKEFLYEGMSRSEPVMTVDEHGIIDNYFIYAGNHEMPMGSPPMIAFGIYSDIGKTAYINTGIYDEGAPLKKNQIDRGIIDEEYIREYERLYRELRKFVFQNCDDAQKDVLGKYVEHLYRYLETGCGKIIWRLFLVFLNGRPGRVLELRMDRKSGTIWEAHRYGAMLK